MFDELAYGVYENQEVVKAEIRLHKPAKEDMIIQVIDTSINAIGESTTCYYTIDGDIIQISENSYLRHYNLYL